MSTPQTTPPASVRNAMKVIWMIVALRLFGTGLQIVAPEQFELASEATTQAPSTQVTVLSAMFGLGLIAVFVLFALAFQAGARWARTTLLILSLLFLAFSLFGVLSILVGTEVTTVATFITVLNLVLLCTLVNFLVKADTAEWCQR